MVETLQDVIALMISILAGGWFLQHFMGTTQKKKGCGGSCQCAVTRGERANGEEPRAAPPIQIPTR